MNNSKFNRDFFKIAFILALFILSACSNIPVSNPVATSTSVPSFTPPPSTPTQMPSATALASPTATEQLTPQEQPEQDYGVLVPKNENCVKSDNISLGNDYIQTGSQYTVLHVRATDPNNAQWLTLDLGRPEDKKPRDVLVLPVVCRDSNKNIIKFGLIIGGRDFGKNGADLNAYYNYKPGGQLSDKGFQVVPAERILENIAEGDLMAIDVVIKPGQGDFKKLGDSWGGATNELAIIALLMVRYDETYSQAVNQLAQGSHDIPNDFIIIPSRLELNPQ